MNGRCLQEDNGSGAAQWQFTYLTNGAYRITNVKRGSDQCDQKVLGSLPSGSSDIQILDTDDRCCSQLPCCDCLRTHVQVQATAMCQACHL